MAPQRIKIHQIGKAQAVKVSLHEPDQRVHTSRITGGMIALCQSLVSQDVLNFPYTDAFHASVLHGISQRPAAGRQRKVAAVSCPFEAAGLSDKRPCDNPAYAQFTLEHFPGNPAEFVEFFRREKLLMAGNLEYAVSAGINNRRMILQVFLAQFLQDHRTGSSLVYIRWLSHTLP